jgi:hypothetical protein
MSRLKWAVLLLGLAAGCIGGCASLPQPSDLRDSVAAYPGGSVPAALDGRARFREIFCQLAAAHEERDDDVGTCDELLWALQDEPAPAAPPSAQPALASDLRFFVVNGAFGDCRTMDTIPYGSEIEQLASRGVRIEAVMVSGRSGTEHNARQLAEAIERSGIGPGDRIVLIGYSKGAVDILQFLSDFPDRGRQVVSVVSIAGAIYGSHLAAKADWWYRNLFAESFAKTCDPGDGQVISSLLPETRRQWLEEHPLPAHVTYFSLAAFTTEEHLSRGLKVPWRILASYDRRNDGQLLAGDAVIPDSTLLGYVNADHWDVAISLELQMPHLSARKSPRLFPRAALLEATLGYVSESLEHSRLVPAAEGYAPR